MIYDIADELAQEDADLHLIVPEPFFGAPKYQLKKELQDWGAKEMTLLCWKAFEQKLINSLPNRNNKPFSLLVNQIIAL